MKTCGNGHTVIFWDEETPWGCPLCVSRQNAADLRCRLDTAREERDIKTGLITYWKERAEEAEDRERLARRHVETTEQTLRAVEARAQDAEKELAELRKASNKLNLALLTAMLAEMVEEEMAKRAGAPDIEARVRALDERVDTLVSAVFPTRPPKTGGRR